VTYFQFDSNIRVLYVFLGFLKNTWKYLIQRPIFKPLYNYNVFLKILENTSFWAPSKNTRISYVTTMHTNNQTQVCQGNGRSKDYVQLSIGRGLCLCFWNLTRSPTRKTKAWNVPCIYFNGFASNFVLQFLRLKCNCVYKDIKNHG
jgi:hypothetical protein